jgi:hypothetical protein
MRSHGCFSNPWYLKNVPPFCLFKEFFRYNSEKWWYKEPLCTHGTQSATANQWLLNGAGHEMGKLRKSCRFNSFTTFTSVVLFRAQAWSMCVFSWLVLYLPGPQTGWPFVTKGTESSVNKSLFAEAVRAFAWQRGACLKKPSWLITHTFSVCHQHEYPLKTTHSWYCSLGLNQVSFSWESENGAKTLACEIWCYVSIYWLLVCRLMLF